MAIVNMTKFQLVLLREDKDEVLQSLQKFGDVHFVDLSENNFEEEVYRDDRTEKAVEISEDLKKVDWSIARLSEFAEKPKGLESLNSALPSMSFEELESSAKEFDFRKVYAETRKVVDDMAEKKTKMDALKGENDRLRPWTTLDVKMSSLESWSTGKILVGSIPTKFRASLDEDLVDAQYTYMEIVGNAGGNTYLFFLVGDEEVDSVEDALRKNGFTEEILRGDLTPSERIAANEKNIRELEHEREQLSHVLRKLSKDYLKSLEIEHEYLSNRILRETSSSNFLASEYASFLEGYVPTESLEEMKQFIQEKVGQGYYMETKEAESDDEQVPIALKNSKLVEPFESMVYSYSLPRYNELDPTPFMAPFYWVFFGMMVADAGFGLLTLVLTTIVLKKFRLKKATAEFVRFFQILSISIIFWGIIYGGFFGDLAPWKGLIDTNKDYTLMIILSVAFGVIHLFFGMGLKAFMNFRDGDAAGAFYDVISWYMALIGVALFLLAEPMGMPPVLKTIGLVSMIVGMVVIVLFSARDERGFGRFAWGIYNLYGITSYIGDLVSYTRLMALGLAGGFISVAVNTIVKMIFGFGIPGILLGAIVFVVFQLFNLFLSMLSAYVHTMRLQYVEYFGKFYDGGGVPFKKFRSEEKYVNIK